MHKDLRPQHTVTATLWAQSYGGQGWQSSWAAGARCHKSATRRFTAGSSAAVSVLMQRHLALCLSPGKVTAQMEATAGRQSHLSGQREGWGKEGERKVKRGQTWAEG